jgi:hypothetical protein
MFQKLKITYISFIWIKFTIDSTWARWFSAWSLQSIEVPGSVEIQGSSCFKMVTHFHPFHLNQIHNWMDSSQKHFQIHHFIRLKFHGMLKFLDHCVSKTVHHLHQLYLDLIHGWIKLIHLLFQIRHLDDLKFPAIFEIFRVLRLRKTHGITCRLKQVNNILRLSLLFLLILVITDWFRVCAVGRIFIFVLI